MRTLALSAAIGIVLFASPALSRLVAQQTGEKIEFELASIRPSRPGDGSQPMVLDISKGRFRATKISVTVLMRFAFDEQLPTEENSRAFALFGGAGSLQIFGGPDWIRTERFDVEAVATPNQTPSQRQFQRMMQSLLEERFLFRAHREQQQVPTYRLVVDRADKMKQSSQASRPDAPQDMSEKALPQLPPGTLRTFVLGQPNPAALVHTMYGNAVTMSNLAEQLGSWSGRAVVDKTNLTGVFDILLEFSSESLALPRAEGETTPQVPTGSPSIFLAVREQLGLKLEPDTGFVERLVIDRIERPSEN